MSQASVLGVPREKGTVAESSRSAIQLGVDSFATAFSRTVVGQAANDAEALGQLVERIEHAERAGLDVFGIGEHHRREFLDSAPPVILAAAAARTHRIPVDQRRDRFERG